MNLSNRTFNHYPSSWYCIVSLNAFLGFLNVHSWLNFRTFYSYTGKWISTPKYPTTCSPLFQERGKSQIWAHLLFIEMQISGWIFWSLAKDIRKQWWYIRLHCNTNLHFANGPAAAQDYFGDHIIFRTKQKSRMAGGACFLSALLKTGVDTELSKKNPGLKDAASKRSFNWWLTKAFLTKRFAGKQFAPKVPRMFSMYE